MTRCIVTRSGQRVERLSYLPSAPRFHCAGDPLSPSGRMGSRWAALPVEGSRAWRDSQPLFTRLFSR